MLVCREPEIKDTVCLRTSWAWKQLTWNLSRCSQNVYKEKSIFSSNNMIKKNSPHEDALKNTIVLTHRIVANLFKYWFVEGLWWLGLKGRALALTTFAAAGWVSQPLATHREVTLFDLPPTASTHGQLLIFLFPVQWSHGMRLPLVFLLSLHHGHGG